MFVFEHLLGVFLHEIAVEEPELFGRGSTVQLEDTLLPLRVDGRELLYEPVEAGRTLESEAVDGGGLFPAFWGGGLPTLMCSPAWTSKPIFPVGRVGATVSFYS